MTQGTEIHATADVILSSYLFLVLSGKIAQAATKDSSVFQWILVDAMGAADDRQECSWTLPPFFAFLLRKRRMMLKRSLGNE